MANRSKTKKKKTVSPLRVIRIVLATIFGVGITLMLMDFTGVTHRYLGWMANVQLLPAILAVNVGVVVALLLLTLLFGRVYCSVICPMGIMQDVFTGIGNKTKKNRFRPHKANNWLRYTMLVAFIVLMVCGLNSIAILIAPYSAYGRIAQSLFAPVYAWVNNLFAQIAERADSYAFYSTEVWLKSGITLGIAVVTFIVVGVMAAWRGRLWCNTICPVGGLLSLVSRFSLFRPVIDADKCTKCRKCERNCKAECIDIDNNHKVDMSRCVGCMNCLEQCSFGALNYKTAWGKKSQSDAKVAQAKETTQSGQVQDQSRRRFITTTATVAAVAAVNAQHKTTDGGLAVIEQKRVPYRAVPLKPAGSRSLKHFSKHCTACQLCVSACPNKVLRPSDDIKTLMQPEMGFERGYCMPTCRKCSEVCPAGAIEPITQDEKFATHIGHAVWIKDNCVVLTDGVHCGNCAKHCPVHAIMMVSFEGDENKRIPVVDEEKCIGCGHCEYVCPSRPFPAIYVEGHEVHRDN